VRTELHIGIDAEKAVVAPYALKTRSGRARRDRTGSVIEYLPVPPSGRSAEDRRARTGRVALPLLFLTAVLFTLGVPWWLPAAASATVIGVVARRLRRAAEFGTFAVPGGAGAHVIWSAPERAAFDRAVVVARRVRHTWPALAVMIDPAEADRTLTRALDELAALLARRQEIRRLRAELAGVRRTDVPAGSAALEALAAQRDRVEHLWRETGEQANRILRGINAAALAGETFCREQQIGAAVRQADLLLATLAAGSPPADAAPELADRTATVISAYRELAGADRG